MTPVRAAAKETSKPPGAAKFKVELRGKGCVCVRVGGMGSGDGEFSDLNFQAS